MADASGVFLNTVRGALVVAEAEISGKDGQINNISEALDDLRGLLAPVSVRHFKNRTGFKHILGDYFPMFRRQAIDGLRHFSDECLHDVPSDTPGRWSWRKSCTESFFKFRKLLFRGQISEL